ncbi:efflux RND transporter periplasmic adaptor subunit [Singulisphaera rosea]
MGRPRAIATSCAATVVVASLIAGCERGNTYVPPPPPEVTVSVPLRKSVTNYLQYTGTTKAVETVDLRARVKGFLKEKHFQAGADVKAGQLLFVIEEEPFQATLEEAKANRAAADSKLKTAEQSKRREVATAKLAYDQALYLLAKVEETRQRNLFSRNASSREDLDKAQAELKKDAAQVESDRADLEQAQADYETNILSAKANVEATKAEVRNAEIDLSYCRVFAPIDGRISRNLVDVGNLVGDGQATVVATILKEDPIYAYMSVSEADLLRFREQVRQGTRVDYRTGNVPLDLGLANEEGFPHKGRVEYTDPGVDPGSGTVTARGLFPNVDHQIISGLFVRIRVALEERKDALLVPERALGADQVGTFVLVVDKNNVVERRPVKVGAAVDGMRVVEENLKADDLIVVNGLQRARPDAKVNPRRVDPGTTTSADLKPSSTPLSSSNAAAASPAIKSTEGATTTPTTTTTSPSMKTSHP